jgi:hypothetical protein
MHVTLSAPLACWPTCMPAGSKNPLPRPAAPFPSPSPSPPYGPVLTCLELSLGIQH